MFMRHKHRDHDMMESMMDSKVFQMIAIGTLVYMGAKAIRGMMED